MHMYFIPVFRDGRTSRILRLLGVDEIMGYFDADRPQGPMRQAVALTGPVWAMLALLLYLALLHSTRPPPLNVAAGRIAVTLAPAGLVARETAAQAPAATPPESAPAPTPITRKPPVPRPSILATTSPSNAPLAPMPPMPQVSSAPADDMMARVQAMRQRRSAEEQFEKALEQQGQDSESAAARANRIAQANVQASSGVRSSSGHGMFEIRSVGIRSAHFTFYGWNNDFRRDWGQPYDVEQGNEPTLELAVVRKMIEIIRQNTHGDFVWQSHRLGRDVRLSARQEDNAGLEDFLLREFSNDFDGGRPRR